jgi:hypothetical protein
MPKNYDDECRISMPTLEQRLGQGGKSAEAKSMPSLEERLGQGSGKSKGGGGFKPTIPKPKFSTGSKKKSK